LLEIDDEIRVRDLKIPAGVELEAGPDEMVAKVAVHHAPKAEEILVAPEELAEAVAGEAAPAEAPEGEEKAAVAKPGEAKAAPAKAAPAKAAPAKGERAEKGDKEKPARG
jgi:hypothetical protein